MPTPRDLAYAVFRGENERPGIHIESDDKRFEYEMSDFISSRAKLATWDAYLREGGPFARREGEGLLEWLERVDPGAYDWEGSYEGVPSAIESFERRMREFASGDRFVVLKVLGPTEVAEGFFAPGVRASSGQLAHRFGFGVLASLDLSRAARVYERIAAGVMELVRAGAELDFVDGVRVADDVATYSGPAYPKGFLSLYLEWHRRLASAIRRRGKVAILHTDGDVTKLGLLRELCRAYDGLHPLDLAPKSTVADALDWVRRVCSARGEARVAVFFTGVPIELVFGGATPRELVEVVRELIGCHGVERLVVATTHSPYPGRGYHEARPAEKVRAVRDYVLSLSAQH